MVRWKLKSCPRCGSDMFVDKDFERWYQQCLMCSYRIDLERIPVANEPVMAGKTCGNENEETYDDE